MSTLATIVLLASLAPVILVGAITTICMLVEDSVSREIGK